MPDNSQGPGADWIQQELQRVGSTDDPGYWQKVIREHNDYDNQSARNYWTDRIDRGDGSNLVKSGQLQKFQDSPNQGLGGNLGQLLQMLLGGGMNGMNQGAQPYNPHAHSYNPNGTNMNGNQGMNGAVQNANQVSTNGTLIGTSGMGGPSGNTGFNGQAGNQQQEQQNNSGMSNGFQPKPKWSPFSNNGIMNSQNTPMGSPTFYQNGNPLSASQKNNSMSYTNNVY